MSFSEVSALSASFFTVLRRDLLAARAIFFRASVALSPSITSLLRTSEAKTFLICSISIFTSGETRRNSRRMTSRTESLRTRREKICSVLVSATDNRPRQI